MRGRRTQLSMLTFVDVAQRVPLDRPLRPIRRIADQALAERSPIFDRTTFTKKRQRLLQRAVVQPSFDEVVVQADGLRLMPCRCAHFATWDTARWRICQSAPTSSRGPSLRNMGSRTCWTPVDQTIRGECSSRGMLPPVRERIDATVWSTPVKKGRPRWFRARRSRSGLQLAREGPARRTRSLVTSGSRARS